MKSMKSMRKAIIVAAIQVLIVCSLGAKLLYDRNTRPRAWFKTQRYDPNLPIRGRYVSLRIEVKDPRSQEEIDRKYPRPAQQPSMAQFPRFYGSDCGSIDASNGEPVAVFEQSSPSAGCANLSFAFHRTGDKATLTLNEPIVFFIPDTARDPTRLANGEELWVLATIPRKGPPRPIALGVKKASDSAITPLNLN